MSNSESSSQLIFISHKSEDILIVKSLVELLKSEMDNVTFFLSEEIDKGDLWREKIETKLKEAKCLLLLYTDTSYDWTWCLYEAILYDELVSKLDPENHKLYCIHYLGSPPPDPLQKLQTIKSTNDDISEWLANFYKTTGQSDAFRSLEATSAKVGDLLRNSMPKKYATTDLRPSIRIFPAWSKDGKQTPNWSQLAKIPRNLPLADSAIETDVASALQLGFGLKPDRMNIVDFLNRLDTEGSQVDRPWVSQFLESLQATLEGRIADQNIVFFWSVSGRILRPIIESITRSENGLDCSCKVVFVDAFSAPPVKNPSPLQLLANGLRLAVRTRIEVLDRYKGKLAKECSRIAQSTDPADELGKRNPIGGRVLETIRTIVLEAEMQGTHIYESAPILFDGKAQIQYQEIRTSFSSMLTELKRVVSDEDKDPEKMYTETERLLKELDRLNKNYIELAGPKFLEILNSQAPEQKVRIRASLASMQATLVKNNCLTVEHTG
jgi:TIR domain